MGFFSELFPLPPVPIPMQSVVQLYITSVTVLMCYIIVNKVL